MPDVPGDHQYCSGANSPRSRSVAQLTRLAAVGALLLAGCGARYGAHTVGKGNAEIRASIGGPVMSNVGPPLPVPLVRAGMDFGVAENVDFEVGVQATAAAFGVAAGDLGVRWQVLTSPDGSALAFTGFVDLSAGLRGGLRAYPELGLHGELPFGPRWRAHGGVLSLVQFTPPDGKPPLLLAPYAAVEYGKYGSSRYAIQLALISPWNDSVSVVDWEPGNSGALLVRFAYRRAMREVSK